VAVGLWPGATAAEVAGRLDELLALGATDVAIVVGWRQPDVRATAIAPGPVADDVVRAALAAAVARGLRATLFPILQLDRVRAGEWRGTLAPADVDAWWSSYEAFIVHHADLAAAAGAAALVIGSELGSTEAWRDRWYHLISRVERRYRGALLYSANWDHYRQVSFWDRVDAIGVTGYFELTGDRAASVEALAAAWARARDELVAYADGRGQPLWLTEVGYPSVDGGAVRPWDYTRRGALDVEEQRRGFAALARAWAGQPLAGLFVWEWSGAGGPRDPGYTPRGKPAACELAAWFQSGNRTAPR
jgi:hypothetical protein